MSNQLNQKFSKSSMNDFDILTELGKGSFGCVYKVRRKTDSKIYALKKVSFSKLNPKEKENSLNEIRILASISNQNIIEYKDAFYDSENNSLCLVMEYAEYGDLEKKIQTRAKQKNYFPEYDILSILVQITKGLKDLHEKNIMHRDIKSANIFMFKNDVVKIGDLNVSKILKNKLHNTQTGTPYYASPEVWDNHPYDFKSDIWSLGCLLYEISALKAPFRGTSMKMVYDKVKQGIYEPIPKFYSKSLSGLIYICLQSNPLYRPTCDQLLNLIRDKLKLFNLGGKKLKVLDDVIDDNIYSEKICNRLLQTDEEESKCDLLDTIKMPKRPNEINSLLPKNRYASSASKRIQKSLLNYKGKLPKLNISDLRIINTNGNRNKSKDKQNKSYLLNKNYSEANIHTVNDKSKDRRGRSKYNNMNYLESKNDSDDEIKEEIQIQSNNTSMNKLTTNENNDIIVQKNYTEEKTIQPKSNSQKKLDIKNNLHSDINDALLVGIHNVNYNKLNSIFSNKNIHKITPFPKSSHQLINLLSPKSIETNHRINHPPLNIRKQHALDEPVQINEKVKDKVALSELQEDISKINQIIQNISQIESSNIDSKIPSRRIPSNKIPIPTSHFEQKEIKMNQNRASSALVIQRRSQAKPPISNQADPSTIEVNKRISRFFKHNNNKDLSNLNISALPTIEKSDLFTLPNKNRNQYNNNNTIQKERDSSVERQLRMPKKISLLPSSGKHYRESVFNNYRRNACPIKINPIIQREGNTNNKTHLDNNTPGRLINIFMNNNDKEDNSVMNNNNNLDKILRGFKIIKSEV